MSGRIIRELVPSATNERNSEGAFIELKNGALLFAYTRYRGGGFDDHSIADIYGILSNDDGESFGEPFKLLSCDEVDADNIMSVSLIRMQNGDLGMFYLRKHNAVCSCIPYLALSSDEGKSWHTQRRCIAEESYFVLNNDRVIRLDNGRLLMPVAKHPWRDNAFQPGSVFVYASDDDGRSWYRLSRELTLHPVHCRRDDFTALNNCMEPGIVRIESGSLWCYIRTQLGRQYETFSDNRGATWEAALPSPFTSPDSPMCVKRLKSGNLFAVWNPIPSYNGRSTVSNGIWTGGRTRLVYSILDGAGNYNSDFHILEDDETRGFCYCAIHETAGGDILLAYCAGGSEDRCILSRLRIRKLYRAELEAR